MFVGRKKELEKLNRLYDSNEFQFVVMYGRRRIGKTELLKNFTRGKNVLFFSAVEKKNNLDDFSEEVFKCFHEKTNMKFLSWKDAFLYISEHVSDRMALIIDEFPYIAKNEPEIKSILQHIIDHVYKEKNIMLILCGSSVSFMVNEVMGEKSPLYARNTAMMEILPFDYTAVKEFLPSYSKENQMLVYGILGGVPYYLSRFSDKKTLEENIVDIIISSDSILRNEPINLLRAELRDPMTYNSILYAIANGAVKMNEIADKIHLEVTKLPVYLNNLIEMRIIEKIVCCGEKETSRKTQYQIKDNFFAFWYRFVFSRNTEIELMDSLEYVFSIKNEIQEYMGFLFERICMQYLCIEAQNKKLPFIPQHFGKWWGSNPVTKLPDDIDILGIREKKYIFCECKFRNESFDLKEFKDLLTSSMAFSDADEKYYYVFVKSNFTSSVLEEAKKYNVRLITIDKM